MMWYHPDFPPSPPDLKKLASRFKKKLPAWVKALQFSMGQDLGGPALDATLHVEEGAATLEHSRLLGALLNDALLGKGPWGRVYVRLLTDSDLRELEEYADSDDDEGEDTP